MTSSSTVSATTTAAKHKTPHPLGREMRLYICSMWGRRILSSLILERVTGQKTEKHGTQRCRGGQDKEEYRSQKTGDRSQENGNGRNIGRVEWWKDGERRILDPRSWILDAERMGKEKNTPAVAL